MTFECTTTDCANHTSAYLCTQCISDLQQWIDKAMLLIPELDVTIARLDVTRPGNPETRSSNHGGSAAPANLDALQLKINMQTIDPDAKVYALDPRAAGLAWLIQDWTKKAELMISGPEATTPRRRDEIMDELRGAVDPMTAKECATWLSKKTGIHFTSKRIRNWVQRRGLVAVETEGHPKYRPEEVLAAYHRHEREVA